MYNKYFLRCIEKDYENMVKLGILLGAIGLTPRMERTVEREIVKTSIVKPKKGANVAAFYKSTPTGKFEQVTEVIEPRVYATNGGCWHYVGVINVPNGNMLKDENGMEYPDTSPLVDRDGNVYIHANLITPINLREASAAVAKDNPDIAEGLADLSRYFVTDADGNAVAPANPHTVFAT